MTEPTKDDNERWQHIAEEHAAEARRADPRTDGVGDGGKRELDPPSEEEIAAGVEYDREHRARVLREIGEPEDDEG